MDTTTLTAATITMHTPPENQGQIVTTSYGSYDGGIFRRIHDASDNTTEWGFVSWDDCSELKFEPWNSAPELPEGVSFRKCSGPT